MIGRILLSGALCALAACGTTTGDNSVQTAVAQRIDIASMEPGAYGRWPCTQWGMAAELSMLGYQLGMRPTQVMGDLPREVWTAENARTMQMIMGNVTRLSQGSSDAEKIYVAERYRDLVVEECQMVRRR